STVVRIPVRPYGLVSRTSINTLKDSPGSSMSMVAIDPTKPTPLWGNREFVRGEFKRRANKSSWRHILIGAAIFLTFFVLLLFLDFLG
ncbi:MAG: hypothetical protein JSV94_01675, partial [Methanobacteriota archaeon]